MRTPIPFLLALAALSSAVLAQDPAPEAGAEPEPHPGQGPVLPELPRAGGGEQAARKEMIELFQKVETRLAEIDELLYDASAGEGRIDGVEAVIGELLDASAARSKEVLDGMDRILEIAQQFGSPQGGGGGQDQNQEGQSPMDGQPEGEQGQKEKAPELEPGGEESGGGEQPHQGDRQQPGGGQPHSPAESDAPPENREAQSDPPGGETGRVEVTDTTGRWGDLPVHVRELFRNEGGGELPSQYRDWIDGYYRRLNRRR